MFFVGLFSPCRELHGVACFGHGPAGNVRKIIGDEKIGFDALCLERGACVHYAPPNAASLLINSACKLLHRATGTALFFAYADPMAGEYGAVYQAAGWVYLGQGLDGKKGRERRYFVLAPGGDPNVATNWKTTRVLRRHGRQLKFSDCVRLGDGSRAGKHRDKWQIAQRAAKHVYAVYVGGKSRDRKAWRERLGGLAYPAPRPLLKRKPPPADRPAVAYPAETAAYIASLRGEVDVDIVHADALEAWGKQRREGAGQ
jgi:hypothetical protein